MKFKDAVLEKLESLDEFIVTAKSNMDRHTITPDQLYKTLSDMQAELERIKALVTRE